MATWGYVRPEKQTVGDQHRGAATVAKPLNSTRRTWTTLEYRPSLRPVTDGPGRYAHSYGSEGWGFESFRTRQARAIWARSSSLLANGFAKSRRVTSRDQPAPLRGAGSCAPRAGLCLGRPARRARAGPAGSSTAVTRLGSFSAQWIGSGCGRGPHGRRWMRGQRDPRACRPPLAAGFAPISEAKAIRRHRPRRYPPSSALRASHQHRAIRSDDRAATHEGQRDGHPGLPETWRPGPLAET